MGLVESEAIVLRTYNLAEADKIVVCLTRKAGVVRAVARGARRLKSKYGAGLEPFTVLSLSFYEKEGRELVSMREAEILRSYFHLSGSAELMSALAYMSELVLEFAPPHEPNEKLFRMINACVEALSGGPENVQALLRYFEVWLLKLAGFLPNMRICADCSRRLSGEAMVYLNAESRPRCQDCSNGQGTPLDRAAHTQLEEAQRLSPEEFARVYGAAYINSSSAASNSQGALAQVTKRLIERILEREPRTQASLR
ncbi:MAG TPA: DNA repair protein RecO [Pyrinomonadaceae bacterium]|nr:DNA repair protein RecO [Pyrinomonadaceae bacterium]